MAVFSFPHSTLIGWNSVGKTFLFTLIYFFSSFIQAFISAWTHRFLFYSVVSLSMVYNPLWPLFILSVRLSQIWHGSLFNLPPVPIEMGPHVPVRIQTLPYLLAPQNVGASSCNFLAGALRIWLFPKKPWCLSLRKGRRHQDLGVGWGHWYWALGLSDLLSRQSGNRCTYAWVPTKSYLDTSICILEMVSSQWCPSPSSPTHCVYSSWPHSVFITDLSDSEKSGFHHSVFT